MSTFEEGDEDPTFWEPLEIKADEATLQGGETTQAPSSSLKSCSSSSMHTWQSSPQGEQSMGSHQDKNSSRQQHEGSQSSKTRERHDNSSQRVSHDDMRSTLMDHPMQLLWSRFFFYFGRELWELDLHLRFAIILVLSGFGINGMLSSSYFFWSPRWILFAILLLGPWIYLERNTFVHRIEALLQTLVSPELLARTLGSIEPSTLRTIFLSILLIPTLFEARTLVFLSHIKAEAGWSLYNVSIAACVFVLQYCLWRYLRLLPRECSQKAVVFLYGSALLVSLCRTDWRRLPWLAAPFFTSTGVLLWSRQGDDQDVLSRVLRQALRQTIRDVVQHVGTTVRQDEMLQLALLRWLVDYWTVTTTTNSTMPSGSGNDTVSLLPPFSSSSEIPTPRATNPPRPSSSSPVLSTSPQPQQRQLEWQDVFPMLEVTADQMALESTRLRGHGAASNVSGMAAPTSMGHGAASPGVSSSSASQSWQTSTPVAEADPFQDLKGMLLNWDIDETAKPAVQSIQRGVVAFPPGRKFAIFFSVARRSPAFLAMLYQVAWGHYFCWSALSILSALISFEVVRLHEWILSCHLATTNVEQVNEPEQAQTFDHANVLQSLDPMVILLSDDIHREDRPASLLRVWRNLGDSVSALQSGLTTARCVQSTAIASEFADNIMSLARFGLDVQEYGWTHGLMVAVQEVFAFHSQDAGVGPTAGYAHAAYGAYYNGRRLYKNANALSEEGELGNVLLPLLGLAPVLIGHGWLWAQHQSTIYSTPKSTVVIEEIIEDEEKDDKNTATDVPRHEEQTHVESSTGKLAIRSESRTDSSTHDVSSSSQRDAEVVITSVSVQEETKPEILETQSSRQSMVVLEETKPASHAGSVVLETVDDADSQNDEVAAGEKQLEDRARLMDLIAMCQVNGLLDETDKNRICEELAKFGSSVDPMWLEGNIRTLEGLLDEHEQTVVTPAAGLESSTDDLLSVSLRSGATENHGNNGVHIMDLAASDEWEGLGTNSSKASTDSLVPVETHEAEVEEQPPQAAVEDTEHQEIETPRILLSMAAIGAAAFGAFVTSRQSTTDTKKDQPNKEKHHNDNNDTDWVQVERRNHE